MSTNVGLVAIRFWALAKCMPSVTWGRIVERSVKVKWDDGEMRMKRGDEKWMEIGWRNGWRNGLENWIEKWIYKPITDMNARDLPGIVPE